MRDQSAPTGEILASLKKFGSLYVRANSFSRERRSAIVGEQTKLFALPDERKNSYRCFNTVNLNGYIPYSVERADDGTPPDPKEVWYVSRELEHRNIWPTELPLFKENVLPLLWDLDEFSSTFIRLLGRALQCQEYCEQLIPRPDSMLRFLRYGRGSIAEGEILAGAHRDIGLFTIHLHHSDGGYECLIDDKWTPMLAADDLLLISAGDMLAHVSNGNILSPLHRVRARKNMDGHRYFLGYFVHPHPTTILRCHPQEGQKPMHVDIRSIDLVNRRLNAMNTPG